MATPRMEARHQRLNILLLVLAFGLILVPLLWGAPAGDGGPSSYWTEAWWAIGAGAVTVAFQLLRVAIHGAIGSLKAVLEKYVEARVAESAVRRARELAASWVGAMEERAQASVKDWVGTKSDQVFAQLKRAVPELQDDELRAIIDGEVAWLPGAGATGKAAAGRQDVIRTTQAVPPAK